MAPRISRALAAMLLCSTVPVCTSVSARCQQAAPSGGAVIVQPGAPGQASTTLNSVTAVAAPRPPSAADIRFMQDMIMHHGQAVEMTELLKTRGKNPEVMELGQKIDVSQTDEMRYMKQWLTDRGVAIETMGDMPGMDMGGGAKASGPSKTAAGDHDDMAGMDMSGMDHDAPKSGKPAGKAAGTDPEDVAMMPGMLTPRQMQALRNARGEQFDYLFLTGMMQHHGGALLMVKQLFSNPGAGQDPTLFDFANDVDNTQLAEIDIMKGILRKVKP